MSKLVLNPITAKFDMVASKAAEIVMPINGGSPTINTLAEHFTTVGSAGVSDGTLTYVTVGTTAVKISVAAGEGYIRTTNDQQGELQLCKWAASPDLYTFSAPAAGQENLIFIGIEYSGGVVTAVAKAAFSDWNWYTNFPLARCSYDGTTMHILNAYAHSEDVANNTRKWMRLTHPFMREEAPEGSGGLELSSSSSPAVRSLAVSAGKVWHGFNNYSLAAIASGTPFFTSYRRAGGGFNTTSGVTQFPNTQYDDGSGTLVTMSVPSKLANLWAYIDVVSMHLHILYGSNEYNSVANAQAETAPSVPSHITYHGRLIARLIFQKSVNTPILIESAWTTMFSATNVGDHSLLSNLQGGAASEYYHLTSAEYTGTGTGIFARQTSPTFLTSIFTPLVIGGAGTTSDLTLQTTSGVGTTGADMHFLVGNNGATEAMTILNSGYVGVGITSPTAKLHIVQPVVTTGSPSALILVGGAHTTLAASAEAPDVNFNLARTVEFATGALTTQRAILVQAPTYGFVGASTLTTAATFAITGAPVAGTFATITTPLALWVQGGRTLLGSAELGATFISQLEISGTVTATASRVNVYALLFGATLTAAANANNLRGALISPSINKGAFTGLNAIGLEIGQNTITGSGTIDTWSTVRFDEKTIATANVGLCLGNHPGGSTNYAMYLNSSNPTYLGSGNSTIGAGGTGTAQLTLTINSGNGAGGEALIALKRNSILGGLFGVVGATDNLIVGSVTGDFAIRNSQGILFSSDGGNSAIMRLTSGGNVGIGVAPATKLHVQQTAAASTTEEIVRFTVSDDATAFFRVRNATSSNSVFLPDFGGKGSGANEAFILEAQIDTDSGAAAAFLFLTLDSTGGTVDTRPLFEWRNSGTSKMFMDSTGNLYPGAAGTQDLGTATLYWDEVNYKTLTDRGCLGSFDNGVEMPDGRILSDVEALKAIQIHPTLQTVYGVPRLDYSTMPAAVYKPAPIAIEDVYEPAHEVGLDKDGNPDLKPDTYVLKYRPGDKMGEDGAETTALISILIGAIKELEGRIALLEKPA